MANSLRKMMVQDTREITSSRAMTACASRLASEIMDRIERSWAFIAGIGLVLWEAQSFAG